MSPQCNYANLLHLIPISFLLVLFGCDNVNPNRITNANQFVAACVAECDRRCTDTNIETAFIGYGCTNEGEYCPSLCGNGESGFPNVVNQSAIGCWCGPTVGMWTFVDDGVETNVRLDTGN